MHVIFYFKAWYNFYLILLFFAPCRSRLRHCASSQKVAGSIPDGSIGIFHVLIPSGCTIALRSTQPLTEMSTWGIFWGLRLSVSRADKPTTFMCQFSRNSGSLNTWSGGRGGTVVKVLRYKSEGRWFDSRWCHWNFSLT